MKTYYPNQKEADKELYESSKRIGAFLKPEIKKLS